MPRGGEPNGNETVVKLELDPAAEIELKEITAFYRKIDPALAARFRDEVTLLFIKIRQNPLIRRERPLKFRRANFIRFPYYLVYVMREDTIFIAAVSHERLKPDHWIDRLDP